ncbi:MAG: CBS domain-containing protein [Candidatus Thiodiazotropha endolucinida]
MDRRRRVFYRLKFSYTIHHHILDGYNTNTPEEIPMLVSDYMSSTPITVQQEDNYDLAFEIMEKKNMHHLPVVDNENQVVGIVTRRDLQLAARYFKEAPVEIAEVMHTPVFTTSASAPLASAAKQMNDNRIGCLPVIGDDKHVAGMLTETDLFRALTDLLDS